MVVGQPEPVSAHLLPRDYHSSLSVVSVPRRSTQATKEASSHEVRVALRTRLPTRF